MAYSFSADAVQYSTGDAYYLRSQSGTEGPVVIDADLHVTGNLQVDKGAVFEQSVHVNENLAVDGDVVSRDGTAGRVGLQLAGAPLYPSVVFGDIAGSQFCALNYNATANSLALIGSNPELDVPGGVKAGAPISASSGGSGVSQMSGGGSGSTAFGTLQSFLNDGTTIAPLYLQPAGEGVLLPFLSLGSLQMNPADPAIVQSAGQFASGTCVIAGLRIVWGLTGNGTSPTVNFKLEGAVPPTPDDAWFSMPPLVFAIPEQYGGVVGYCTPAVPTRNNCNIANTTSGGTGFDTRVYWIAIGPAT